MRFSLLSFAVSGAFLLPAVAKADTFNFSASGNGFSVSGTLIATNNADGSYTITGVNGTGVSGPTADLSFGTTPDNQLFPSAARMLDVDGFDFTDVIGGVPYFVNLYNNASPTGFAYFADQYGPGGSFTESAVNFTVTPAVAATPEPSSVLLLGTGAVAMAAFGFGRRFSS